MHLCLQLVPQLAFSQGQIDLKWRISTPRRTSYKGGKICGISAKRTAPEIPLRYSRACARQEKINSKALNLQKMTSPSFLLKTNPFPLRSAAPYPYPTIMTFSASPLANHTLLKKIDSSATTRIMLLCLTPLAKTQDKQIGQASASSKRRILSCSLSLRRYRDRIMRKWKAGLPRKSAPTNKMKDFLRIFLQTSSPTASHSRRCLRPKPNASRLNKASAWKS